MKLALALTALILTANCGGAKKLNSTSSGGGSSSGSTGTTGSDSSGAGSSSGASGGASSGLGSSSGAGGSSAGAVHEDPGPQKARFNVVNAATGQSGLDVCVKAHGVSVFGSAVATNVAYAHASPFTLVSSASDVDIAVVATGTDCNVKPPLFERVAEDFSNKYEQLTLVTFTAANLSLNGTVVHQSAPDSGSSNLAVVDALKMQAQGDTATVTLTSPHLVPLTGALPGDSASADIAPFASNALTLDLFSGTTALPSLQFPGLVAANNTRVSAIIMGEVGASGATTPSVLLCSNETDTPTCVTKVTQDSAFAQVANLSASTTLSFWQATNGGLPLTLVATLPAGTASSYFTTPAGTNKTGLCVTTAATAPSAFPCTTAAATASFTLTSFQYATIAFNGSGNMVSMTTMPTTADPTTVLVSSLNMMGGISGAVTVTSHQQFGMLISNATPYEVGSTLAVPQEQWSLLSYFALDFSASTQHFRLRMAGDVPQAPAVSVLYGGSVAVPYALICSNDGTVDSDGHSACLQTTLVGSAQPGYVRFIDLNRSLNDFSICAGGVDLVDTSVQNASAAFVTEFFAIASGTTSFDITALQDCSSVQFTVTVAALVAGSYSTLALIGDGGTQSTFTAETAPPRSVTEAAVTASNGWVEGSAQTLTIAIGGTQIGSPLAYPSVSTNAYTTLSLATLSGATMTIHALPSGTTYTYNLPGFVSIFGGGIYSVRVVSDPDTTYHKPVVIFSADNLANFGDYASSAFAYAQ